MLRNTYDSGLSRSLQSSLAEVLLEPLKPPVQPVGAAGGEVAAVHPPELQLRQERLYADLVRHVEPAGPVEGEHRAEADRAAVPIKLIARQVVVVHWRPSRHIDGLDQAGNIYYC